MKAVFVNFPVTFIKSTIITKLQLFQLHSVATNENTDVPVPPTPAALIVPTYKLPESTHRSSDAVINLFPQHKILNNKPCDIKWFKKHWREPFCYLCSNTIKSASISLHNHCLHAVGIDRTCNVASTKHNVLLHT